MRRITFYVMIASAVAAVALACSYVYEGKWGSFGSGNGQFDRPWGMALAANGTVYIADSGNYRVQSFTATGSFVTKWGSFGTGNGKFIGLYDVSIAPNNNVYTLESDRVQYFSPSGSFMGKWGSSGTGNGQFISAIGIAVAPNGNVYVTDSLTYRVQYFTATGSFLGKWGSKGSGNGQFSALSGIDVTSGSEVYVADYGQGQDRIQVFTLTGSFLRGFRYGQDFHPMDVAVSNYAFVAGLNSILYFSKNGSYLGSFGRSGSGNGEFIAPSGLDVSGTGRIYVVDATNNRVQYFRPENPAVTPTSLGRVKALFN
jgi:sugar lactone lactonase YvrE